MKIFTFLKFLKMNTNKRKNIFTEAIDISDEQFNEAWDLTKQLFIKIHKGFIPFKINNTVSNTIVLERVKPSRCPICNVVHNNVNSFLLIIEKSVYFYCNRALLNKKLLIGSIDNKIQPTAPDIKIPTKPPSYKELFPTINCYKDSILNSGL